MLVIFSRYVTVEVVTVPIFPSFTFDSRKALSSVTVTPFSRSS